MDKLTVKDISLKGKKVIMRADFNVPLDEDLNVTDDIRIRSALPTIEYILEQGASKLILMSHLGRPKGQVVDNLRLTPVAKTLSKLIGTELLKLDDCVGDFVGKAINESTQKVILLENLRFYKEETDNDPEFAKKLASFADIYVNDAFGTAHRAHASTEGIAKHLPSAAGFLLEKEINFLGQAVENPKRPFVVVLGGAKVSDKILLVENLLDKANAILIGGGMAYTFLKAQGKEIGRSKLEEDKIDNAKELIEKAEQKGVTLGLTDDYVIVEDWDKPETKKISDEIPAGWESLDIGPKTREKFKEILKDAQTIVWNGPLGVFERDEFADGTKEIADFLATLKEATTIIGGGDSAAAVKKYKLEDAFSHISTGGGASLEFLEGKVLPGIAALSNRDMANQQ